MNEIDKPVRIRVSTFNYKRGGWDKKTRRHNHVPLLDTLARHPAADVLSLPECTRYTNFNSQPLYELLAGMDDLLPGFDFYRHWLSDVPGSRNRPGLFVNARKVRPVEWYDADDPDVRECEKNMLVADIAGMTVGLKSVHWNGSKGPRGFDLQSAETGQLGSRPTLVVGDFNVTSGTEGEIRYDDWGERCEDAGAPWKRRQKGEPRGDNCPVYTDPMDQLLADGFWDAGAVANDFTPTVNKGVDFGSELRIDRIIASHRLPARLVPDSYYVEIPEDGKAKSDHRFVTCQLDFHPSFART